MPGVLSQPGQLAMPWEAPGNNSLAPHQAASPFHREEWNMKSQQGMPGMSPSTQQPQNQLQQGMPGMSPSTQQPQNPTMQSAQLPQSWECPQGWQGQLGPNLMPLTRNSQNVRNGYNLPRGGPLTPNTQRSNMQQMPNMMGLPSARVAQDTSSMQRQNVPPNMQNSPMQPVPEMSNMQSQLMQVIALPVGAPPPEGAIPMGAAPAGAVQEQVIQMIAVPMGEAPPEGAIPVDPATAASMAQQQQGSHPQSESAGPAHWPPQQQNRAFKIKDPRTGLEVRPTEETAATSRRMRIVNPRTGEEVYPNMYCQYW